MLLGLFVLVRPAAAVAPTYSVPEALKQASTVDKTSKAELVALTYKVASEKGLDGDKMVKTIDCENPEWNPQIQSSSRYTFSDPSRGIIKGEREQSYGLVQIHLPAHPDVSLKQATNAEFAIGFMADEWQKGRASQWTCFNN